MSRTVVYSPLGVALTDLDVDVFRSWKLNGYSEAQMLVAVNDAKAKEEFLRFGNFVYIRDEKLPDWVGIINPPRKWSAQYVEINLVSAEIILDWRIPPLRIPNNPLGLMLRQILSHANQQGGIPILPGVIWDNAPTGVYVLEEKVSDFLTRWVERRGVDWDVSAEEKAGQLRLYVNMYEKRGEVIDYEYNNQNTEIASPTLTENGPIYNDVYIYNLPEDGGFQFRSAKDDESIALYGLRQHAERLGGGEGEGLEMWAKYKLDEYKQPKNYITPAIINVGEAFSHIRLGNVIRFTNAASSFSDMGSFTQIDARIEGMEYDPDTDKILLVANAYFAKPGTRRELLDWLYARYL